MVFNDEADQSKLRHVHVKLEVFIPWWFKALKQRGENGLSNFNFTNVSFNFLLLFPFKWQQDIIFRKKIMSCPVWTFQELDRCPLTGSLYFKDFPECNNIYSSSTPEYIWGICIQVMWIFCYFKPSAHCCFGVKHDNCCSTKDLFNVWSNSIKKRKG